jgi:hypothetical protein
MPFDPGINITHFVSDNNSFFILREINFEAYSDWFSASPFFVNFVFEVTFKNLGFF